MHIGRLDCSTATFVTGIPLKSRVKQFWWMWYFSCIAFHPPSKAVMERVVATPMISTMVTLTHGWWYLEYTHLARFYKCSLSIVELHHQMGWSSSPVFTPWRNDKMQSSKREKKWNFYGFFRHSNLCAAAAEVEKYFSLTWRKAISLRSTRLYKGWSSKDLEVNLTLTELVSLLFNSGQAIHPHWRLVIMQNSNGRRKHSFVTLILSNISVTELHLQ